VVGDRYPAGQVHGRDRGQGLPDLLSAGEPHRVRASLASPFIDEKKNMNGNSAFYLANAIEFLNQPGEWYEDLDTGKVYYWPRPDEDLAGPGWSYRSLRPWSR